MSRANELRRHHRAFQVMPLAMMQWEARRETSEPSDIAEAAAVVDDTIPAWLGTLKSWPEKDCWMVLVIGFGNSIVDLLKQRERALTCDKPEGILIRVAIEVLCKKDVDQALAHLASSNLPCTEQEAVAGGLLEINDGLGLALSVNATGWAGERMLKANIKEKLIFVCKVLCEEGNPLGAIIELFATGRIDRETLKRELRTREMSSKVTEWCFQILHGIEIIHKAVNDLILCGDGFLEIVEALASTIEDASKPALSVRNYRLIAAFFGLDNVAVARHTYRKLVGTPQSDHEARAFDFICHLTDLHYLNLYRLDQLGLQPIIDDAGFIAPDLAGAAAVINKPRTSWVFGIDDSIAVWQDWRITQVCFGSSPFSVSVRVEQGDYHLQIDLKLRDDLTDWNVLDQPDCGIAKRFIQLVKGRLWQIMEAKYTEIFPGSKLDLTAAIADSHLTRDERRRKAGIGDLRSRESSGGRSRLVAPEPQPTECLPEAAETVDVRAFFTQAFVPDLNNKVFDKLRETRKKDLFKLLGKFREKKGTWEKLDKNKHWRFAPHTKTDLRLVFGNVNGQLVLVAADTHNNLAAQGYY